MPRQELSQDEISFFRKFPHASLEDYQQVLKQKSEKDSVFSNKEQIATREPSTPKTTQTNLTTTK